MLDSNKLNLNLQLQRIALLIQYDGKNYCGWQRQPHQITIQGVLEEAISSLDILNSPKLVAAGRTDSGVHASGQVAHFDCSKSIPAYRWSLALNGRLPKSIRIRDSVLQSSNWHACHSATFRRYRYLIYNGCRPNLFVAPWSWHRYQYRLDEGLINAALKGIVGLHDFTAFQKAGSKRSNAITNIQEALLLREGDLLHLEIQATGFLYGMVRLLVGQLVALGEHKITLHEFERRWKGKLRGEVKESAPARGLSLIRVGYKNKIFPENIIFDSFPIFSLSTNDSPPLP